MTNMPKNYKQLCLFVQDKLEYNGNPNLIGTMHDSIYENGKNCRFRNVQVNLQSLADFFDDNPGAIDAVVDWCKENYPENFEDEEESEEESEDE